MFLVVKLKSSLPKFFRRHHDLCNHYRIPELRRVPLVEQGLLTLPVCPSLPLFLIGFILLDF